MFIASNNRGPSLQNSAQGLLTKTLYLDNATDPRLALRLDRRR